MRLNFFFYEQRIINIDVLNNHLIDYPTPSNLTYLWGFGSLAGFCLIIQIVSGILLAMHYTPHISLAFNSVEHICRDVNFGWLIRYTHANGASIFFIIVYLHIGRGLYFKSYQYEALWISGILIYILMMATAFMGYVLVWGQMSFWGATVITNLFSAIPFVGQNIAQWLWGGFSIQNATLNRFFSLHFLLPFLIAGVSLAHIALLHEKGSSNPLGLNSNLDKITFYPYFYVKDLFWFLSFFCVMFSYFLFFDPNLLGHPDNYLVANALVTPASIIPEWYFVHLYAILRSIPSKEGGVLCMAAAILVLFLLPTHKQFRIKSPHFNRRFRFAFWIFIANTLLLGWLGMQVVEQPFILAGQVSTLVYFSYFLVILPYLLKREF
jgi:ubiquinol-cytochrome c reductase cytochrome b subunit